MTEWHDAVSEKLMLEAQASQMRNMPPRPQMALSDADPTESSRPSSGDSTVETSSIVGAADYFPYPRTNQNGRPHPPTRPFLHTQATARGIAPQRTRPSPSYDAPWSPLRRRSSMPADNRPQYQHPSSWPRGHPTSPHHQYKFAPLRQKQRTRPRTPSTVSESSVTSDSSYTTSSASLSPVLQSAQVHQPGATQGGDIRRSQSLAYFHPPPGHAAHPNAYHTQVQFPHQRRPSAGFGQPVNQSGDLNMNTNGIWNGRSNPNERGLNVRWPDQSPQGGDTSRVNRSGTVRGPDRQTRSARSVDGRRSERERERERRGQSVGVGGRMYA